jgi:TatA/E family protein of Tat protein translocase
MFGSLGIPELIAIFIVVLIVFGPRKLPEIGRTLGKALGEFRKATDDFKNTIEREVRLEELKGIKAASMDSFVTPVEAVSRTTPSALVADATVTGTSPDSGVVESSSLRVDEPAALPDGSSSADAFAPSTTPASATPTLTNDEDAATEVSSTRRLDDSTT